jgi:hypothetical protein
LSDRTTLEESGKCSEAGAYTYSIEYMLPSTPNWSTWIEIYVGGAPFARLVEADENVSD